MPNRGQASDAASAGRQVGPQRSARASGETLRTNHQRSPADSADGARARPRRQRPSATDQAGADERARTGGGRADASEAAPAIAPELPVEAAAITAEGAPEVQPAPFDSAPRRTRATPSSEPAKRKANKAPKPARRKTASRGRARLSPARKHRDHTDEAVVEGPLVAPKSLGGRSLTLFLAVMTFLSALLVGGVVMVDRAATAWTDGILDEVSVTVMPLDDGSMERRLTQVATTMGGTPGLRAVTVRSVDETEDLLKPWLGDAVSLDILPVPRLVTAQRTDEFSPEGLDLALATIPGVTLDDHSGWNERLAGAARSAASGAVVALSLMLIATAVAVVLATRSAVIANAHTVDVLTLLGAEDRYVARAFSAKFLSIGARGAAFGLCAALVLFSALEVVALFEPARASVQSEALFRAPRIGAVGFVGLFLLGLFMLALVWATSHLAVSRQLDRLKP